MGYTARGCVPEGALMGRGTGYQTTCEIRRGPLTVLDGTVKHFFLDLQAYTAH